MDENVKYALNMLYMTQKCMKIALAIEEKQPLHDAEVETLRHKLEAIDWLIELAIKEG